jgi:hypothetical protein
MAQERGLVAQEAAASSPGLAGDGAPVQTPAPGDGGVVHVSFDGQGKWTVALVPSANMARCSTFNDAARVGRRWAAQRRPDCELIVHDAYHRVVERPLVA